MIYIDTNVIISYMDELDSKHDDAVELLDKISGDRVVSKLTLLELSSVYSRAGLEDSSALAIYSVKSVGAEIKSVNCEDIFSEAIRLSNSLKLKTLDLLHITICKILNVHDIVTFDKGILSSRDIIGKMGIKIITF